MEATLLPCGENMTDKPFRPGEKLSWSDLDTNRLHGDRVFTTRITLVNYYWFAKHPEVIKWVVSQDENTVVMENMEKIMVEAYAELARIKVHSLITHPQYYQQPEQSKHADLIIFLQECRGYADYLTG